MTTFAIDNTPVSVTLGDDQTYTPASGTVQKLKIACPAVESLRINGDIVINGFSDDGEPNVEEITVIATDSDSITSESSSGSSSIHVSGFVVN